jgi:hypothetical protein
VRTEVHVFDLADTNDALDDLRAGRVQGAAVVVPHLTASSPSDGEPGNAGNP